MIEEKRKYEDLHNYQLCCIEHIINNPYCALFLDMGLGKTVSTLTAIEYLMYKELEILKVLVVGTKRVVENVWKQESEVWEHTTGLKIEIVAGTEKQRKAILKRNANVYCVSRDNVSWLCAQYGGSGTPFDMLVIDESTSFKNHKSKRFRAIKLIHFDRIVNLTGTPSPNGLIDLWAPTYLLDKGERLGRTITEYRGNFFVPNQQKGYVVYNYRIKNKLASEKIHKAVGDICISMKAKDYLETKGRTNNNIMIPMSAEIKSQYLQFERDKVLEIFGAGEEITAANAAALNSKLLQFANGAVYDTEKNYHIVHDLKLEALEEILEAANGNPVLLAYSFQSDANRIEQYCAKYKPRRIKTNKDVEDWNAGRILLGIMHPASGGHGLNLQYGGHLGVWFGPTYSLELKLQWEARIDRQGQGFHVIMNNLILKGTIDEDVIRATNAKTEVQDALMNAVRARVKKYLNNR